MKNEQKMSEQVLLMLYRCDLIKLNEMTRKQESKFWLALMDARIKEKWNKH